MRTKDILTLIVVFVIVGFSWFIIKKLFFFALIAGGAYAGYQVFFANRKQIKE